MQNRATIKTYYPQPVDLPQGVERNVLFATNPELVNIHKKLSERDKQGIDTKTLFYDMFFLSNQLICMGPPFYGFGSPLAIKYKKKKLKFKVYPQYNIRSPAIVAIAMKSPMSCDLEFTFRDFNIQISYVHQPLSLEKVALSAVTHQKNNLPIWIKDWCSWHSRVHGVDRIVIYDNGSSYFAELDKILAELDENLEIILVNWPYKFGLMTDTISTKYYYCQIGALNHFHRAFGNQTQWCINLDLDEFLYPLSETMSLREYLATQIRIRPVIELHHYIFPPGQHLTNQELHFYHFHLRYKEDYWNCRENSKYICQPSAVTIMENHYVSFTIFRIIGCLFAAMMKGYGVFINSAKLLISHIYRQYRVQILRRLLLKTYQPIDCNLKEGTLPYQLNKLQNIPLFFGHFRDLYTGWRIKQEIDHKALYYIRKFQRVDAIDPTRLILDKRIAKKAVEVGMVKESEIRAIK